MNDKKKTITVSSFFLFFSFNHFTPSKAIKPLRRKALLEGKEIEKTLVRRKDNKKQVSGSQKMAIMPLRLAQFLRVKEREREKAKNRIHEDGRL